MQTVRTVALAFILTTTPVFAESDVTPPKLVSLSFSPTSVDITATDQVVAVTATISDDLSGIGIPQVGWAPQFLPGAALSFKSPSKSPSTAQNPQFVGVLLDARSRQSGSSTNGIYTNSFIVPRFSEIGRWTVDSIQLADLAGNSSRLDSAALVRAGLSNYFTVQGLTNDVTPPEILAFTASPTTLDASSAGQLLLGQVRVRDDMGLDGSRFGVQVTFESPSARQHLQFSFAAQNKASGDSMEAIYTNSVLLPKYSETGTWSLQAGFARDAVGNSKTFTSKFASIGAVTEIQVQGQASGDIVAPQLQSLWLAQTNVNTTLSNETILFRVHMKYALSGMPSNHYNPVQINFGGPGGQPFGVRFADSMLESGDRLDGFYTNLVTLPTFLQAGLWLPISMVAGDTLGVLTTWNLSDLRAQGWGSGFTIQNSPAIAARETASTILLAWPTPAEAFYLEGNSDLANPTGWSRISTQPVEVGGQQIVPLPTTTPKMFFRLTNTR